MATKKERWEKGDHVWQQMIMRDAERAQREQRPAEERCCFGIAIPRRRCKEKATRAGTYYGFTTGVAWCARHGGCMGYPHGFNDDIDAEDEWGMVPIGYSITVEGCQGVQRVTAASLAECLQKSLREDEWKDARLRLN